MTHLEVNVENEFEKPESSSLWNKRPLQILPFL